MFPVGYAPMSVTGSPSGDSDGPPGTASDGLDDLVQRARDGLGPYADDLDRLIQFGRSSTALAANDSSEWPLPDPSALAVPSKPDAPDWPAAFAAIQGSGENALALPDGSVSVAQDTQAPADAARSLSSLPHGPDVGVAALARAVQASGMPRAQAQPAPNSAMKISDDGLNLIKGFESWSPSVYRDQGHAPTIGWGHLVRPGEHFSAQGLTPEDGVKLLRQDVGDAENLVKSQIRVPLTQGQFDAMVSFALNTKGFANSSVVRALNRRDYAGAAASLGRYVHVNTGNGEWIVSRGLVRRRAAEQQMFNGADGRTAPVGLRGPESP